MGKPERWMKRFEMLPPADQHEVVQKARHEPMGEPELLKLVESGLIKPTDLEKWARFFPLYISADVARQVHELLVEGGFSILSLAERGRTLQRHSDLVEAATAAGYPNLSEGIRSKGHPDLADASFHRFPAVSFKLSSRGRMTITPGVLRAMGTRTTRATHLFNGLNEFQDLAVLSPWTFWRDQKELKRA